MTGRKTYKFLRTCQGCENLRTIQFQSRIMYDSHRLGLVIDSPPPPPAQWICPLARVSTTSCHYGNRSNTQSEYIDLANLSLRLTLFQFFIGVRPLISDIDTSNTMYDRKPLYPAPEDLEFLVMLLITSTIDSHYDLSPVTRIKTLNLGKPHCVQIIRLMNGRIGCFNSQEVFPIWSRSIT